MSDDIRQHHDMGGLDKGPIDTAGHEIEPWEKRVEAMVRLLIMHDERLLTVDEFRRGIEELPSDLYDSLSYFERWVATAANLLIEKGILDRATLDARVRELEAAG